MARISGVDLPREKRVEIGLTYIYGIGLTTSRKMVPWLSLLQLLSTERHTSLMAMATW